MPSVSSTTAAVEARAARHAALGDPVRLRIVDDLRVSDRSPSELGARFDLPSNLLAHHLDLLERAGLVRRTRSHGDARRRYVRLDHDALASTEPAAGPPRRGRALFVCSQNSARSQLAAALWTAMTGDPADSAGTHPAASVHPEAIEAGRRVGLDLRSAHPRRLTRTDRRVPVVVTVCDRAREELTPERHWWHWSMDDPAGHGTRAAFEATVRELEARIDAVQRETDLGDPGSDP